MTETMLLFALSGYVLGMLTAMMMLGPRKS